ncbi:hypothetical protein AAFF_G00267430 [Aldrovandia affinis]|uniref:Uncharacterized protein n=1 Tax=Aldrovandia affinis TaxID=143900 RepID=A0AAD7WTH0_9TELE|nr:hypothetical protein AAFF_G00267430 [Aldrovandia affinis]
MSEVSLSGSEAVEGRRMVVELTRDGTEALKVGDHEQALFLFKGAFRSSCEEPSGRGQGVCLFNLGAAYVAVGKPKKGLKCFQRSRQHHQGADGDMNFNVGAAYEGVGQLEKALLFYRRAVRGCGPADALLKLAYCSASTEDHVTAGRSFAQAARAYRLANQREDAAMALREAANHTIRSRGAASETEVLQLLRECLREYWEGVGDAGLRGKAGRHP